MRAASPAVGRPQTHPGDAPPGLPDVFSAVNHDKRVSFGTLSRSRGKSMFIIRKTDR